MKSRKREKKQEGEGKDDRGGLERQIGQEGESKMQ